MSTFAIRRGAALSAVIVTGLATATAASAASLTVNDTTDASLGGAVTCAGAGAPCSLRAAIQLADQDGGASTITVPSGSYRLTIPPAGSDDAATGDLNVDSGAQVTLTGAGSGSTIIDAGGIDRAFEVQAGAGLSLSGLTIENGDVSTNGDGGGAIDSAGALVITGDVALTDDTATGFGGAISVDPSGTLSVNGATVSDDSSGYGAALDDESTSPATIADSAFTHDFGGEYGGAIYNGSSGSLTISHSIIDDDGSGYFGGGISWWSSGALTVSDTAIDSDYGELDGGGVFAASGTETLQDDDVSDDTSQYGGGLWAGADATTLSGVTLGDDAGGEDGGALALPAGQLTAADSSLTGDSAEYGAGVAVLSSSSYSSGGSPAAALTNVTIADGKADQGGALYAAQNVALSLVNDTVTANQSPTGAALQGTAALTPGAGDGVVNTIIAGNAGTDCDAPLPTGVDIGHNILAGSCVSGSGAAGDQIGANPLLAPAADNGGTVLTDRELSGSPAIGAGAVSDCPATDARGVARPQSGGCDIGAYQTAATGLQLQAAAPANATVGEAYTVTLTASDSGPGPATDVTVSAQLPSGLTLQSAQSSSGSCTTSGAQVTCTVGLLSVGASAGATLTVVPTLLGVATDAATAGDDQGDTASATATTLISPPAAIAPAGSSPAGPSRATISPGAATRISRVRAQLSGMLDTSGPTSYFFQFGRGRRRTRVTATRSTTASGPVTLTARHLRPATTYRYRLVAITDGGITYGPWQHFRTAARTHHGNGRRVRGVGERRS